MKILFVCLGNICRSPAAENVLRSRALKQGLHERFEIDSSGILDLHTGKPPDERMVQAARDRGITMKGSARQVRPRDFDTFDWVLAMDKENYRDLLEVQNESPHPKAKLAMFCDFCRRHDHSEVPDPYYGEEEGFEQVLDLLEDGCDGILRKLDFP